MRVLRAAKDVKHPDEPHFYLPFMGVVPELQGQGIGSALIQPVLERCNREGVVAYLEATSAQNRAFYERQGFSLMGEIRLPAGPPLWQMRRAPGGRISG